jgi:PilZ domain
MLQASIMSSNLHSSPNLGVDEDRRRHKRVRVSLLGRYMLPDRREYPCQTIDISCGGVAIYAPMPGKMGDRIVLYIEHLGRLEGDIVRVFDNGFAIQLNTSLAKRSKIADQLTWLINRDILGIEDSRRHERLMPRVAESILRFEDGTAMTCRILDVSVSGAALTCEDRPDIGVHLTLGQTEAKVIRHFDGGFAVEFKYPRSKNSLADDFGGFQI